MNYQYLKHKEIDFAKWDACVDASANGNIYSLSWYLSVVSPGWDGIVLQGEGRYESVMAVTHFMKFGLMKYLAQPPHVNQLGLIYRVAPLSGSIITVVELLRTKFRQITSFPLNEHNEILLGERLNAETPNTSARAQHQAYQLDLSRDYQTIYNSFSADRKKNIKASIKNNLSIEQTNDIDTLIIFHKQFNAPKIYGGVSEHQYSLLKQLYVISKEKAAAEIYAVRSKTDVVSFCLFYFYKNRIIKFCNVSTEEGRALNGDTFLMHTLLETWSNQPKIFDFERASSPGINHYKESFGSTSVTYSSISHSNLPLAVRIFKDVRKLLLVKKHQS